METTRINARLTASLASFVDRMVGQNGLYETPSEYIRDLIRRDMELRADRLDQISILSGYRDRNEGAVMASSGDFHRDMKTLSEKEDNGWH